MPATRRSSGRTPGSRPRGSGSPRPPMTRRSGPAAAASAPGRGVSAGRTAPAGPPQAGGTAERGRPRRTPLTSRAAVLGLVLCTLVVMLAYPVQQYLEQRAQIGHMRDANAALQQQVSALDAQLQQWHDPDFIRQQARSRLFYVMPGETAYVVQGATKPGPGATSTPLPKDVALSRSAAALPGSWYGRLWSSVQQAGRPTAAPHPAVHHPQPAPISPSPTHAPVP